jgi:predicted secreted protein
VPLLLLLLLLGGLVVKDVLTDAPVRHAVAVRDEPQEQPKAAKAAAPVPVKVDIQDEPEERGPEATVPVKVAIKDEPEQGGGPSVPAGPDVPIDPTPHVKYTIDPQTMRVGLTALAVRTKDGAASTKKLTYREDGSTNNTYLKINEKEELLQSPPGGLGTWVYRNKQTPGDPEAVARQRSSSLFKKGDIEVTQIVELAPSKQPVEVAPGVRKRLLDSMLVRYVVVNQGQRAHRVGLRVMVDTFIGENDGVPFAVPGMPGMVDTFADFRDSARAGIQIPDFIQALEVPDLRNPGTVAHMTLKLGGRIESPNRVIITHWPSSSCPWDVPLKAMKGRDEREGDSAVAIYWDEQVMEPGARRELGYGYGLGGVTASEGGGKLGITLGGSFEPGQLFTVTTYVTNPEGGQMLTLDVPAGLEVQGAAKVPVPAGKGTPPTSIVTWQVKVLQTGEFRLRVASNTGISQSKTITITRPAGGRFALALDGSFEPGQVFGVRATVSDALPKQTLTLNLPPGLERVGGQATEPVPAADKGGTSVVTWKVKVLQPGTHAVRVVSSTGLALTKTLRIDAEPGRFVLDLAGDIAPGKDFDVLARVTNPVAGQRLTLQLPDALELKGGEATQLVPPAMAGGMSTVTWRVHVREGGRLPVRVRSTTGVTRAKTITISGPGAGQIFGK